MELKRWEKAVEENYSMEAISRLVERFTVPLQAASANIGEIAGEFEVLVHYAIQSISLSTLDYCEVWWRIFHAIIVCAANSETSFRDTPIALKRGSLDTENYQPSCVNTRTPSLNQ